MRFQTSHILPLLPHKTSIQIRPEGTQAHKFSLCCIQKNNTGPEGKLWYMCDACTIALLSVSNYFAVIA